MPRINSLWQAGSGCTVKVLGHLGDSVKVWWVEGRQERLWGARYFGDGFVTLLWEEEPVNLDTWIPARKVAA